MANPTTNYSWPMPTTTDLVTDLPADFAAFGQPVDTSLKALNPETTLGDIAYRSATANTNTRLGIGSTGQVLTVAAGVPSWATAASGGKVLQVISSNYSTQVSNSTSTYADTGLTATITPSSATSKILVLVAQNGLFRGGEAQANGLTIKLLRDATLLLENQYVAYLSSLAQGMIFSGMPIAYLDSPSSTSALIYKTQFRNENNAASVRVQYASTNSSQITLLEIGA